jgi:tryptophanyl-tRNA synthetase
MQAYTDPSRIRKTDPGHPEGCVVFAYHQKFDPDTAAQVERDCRAGTLGCVEHKRRMAQQLIDALASIRERRIYYENHRDEVEAIVARGDAQAQEVAQATMSEVMEAMQMG